jgi:hypothetical protein
MDPKAVAKAQAAMKSFMLAMYELDMAYLELMERCGVRNIPLHRI